MICFAILMNATGNSLISPENISVVSSNLILKTIYCSAIIIIALLAIAYFVRSKGLHRSQSLHVNITDKVCISPKTTLYFAEIKNKELIIIESSLNVSMTDITTFKLQDMD